MSWIQIDVDLDDVYDNMGSYERRKMAEWLEDDGYFYERSPLVIEGFNTEFNGEKASRLELEFADKLLGLASKFHTMSNEEIEIIENLYKKYC